MKTNFRSLRVLPIVLALTGPASFAQDENSSPDNTSYEAPDATTVVYDAPVPIVDILVATGETIRSTVASSLLESYAGYTGGVFYPHWKKKAVEDQLGRIGAEIHSQYELAYAPDAMAEGGFHRIQVKVRRPGLKARARAGYFFQPAVATKK